jgi:hypothetical protein
MFVHNNKKSYYIDEMAMFIQKTELYNTLYVCKNNIAIYNSNIGGAW